RLVRLAQVPQISLKQREALQNKFLRRISVNLAKFVREDRQSVRSLDQIYKHFREQCSEEDFREVLNGTHGDDGRRRFVQLEGEMLLATENAKLYRQYKEHWDFLMEALRSYDAKVSARPENDIEPTDIDCIDKQISALVRAWMSLDSWALSLFENESVEVDVVPG
ncbi:unnamed protein product, partial [Effrenium voratum]